MYKIAFVGNSRTHKSACFFRVLETLKTQGLKVGYCTDLSPTQKSRNPAAAAATLFRQLSEECEQRARTDIDYLVTERTPMEWWGYYAQAVTDAGMELNVHDECVEQVCANHMIYYDLIFFMAPTELYTDDGCRPISTARQAVMEPHYQDFYEWLGKHVGSKVVTVLGSPLERVTAVEIALLNWLQDHRVERN